MEVDGSTSGQGPHNCRSIALLGMKLELQIPRVARDDRGMEGDGAPDFSQGPRLPFKVTTGK